MMQFHLIKVPECDTQKSKYKNIDLIIYYLRHFPIRFSIDNAAK